jgi:hypothetical protein
MLPRLFRREFVCLSNRLLLVMILLENDLAGCLLIRNSFAVFASEWETTMERSKKGEFRRDNRRSLPLNQKKVEWGTPGAFNNANEWSTGALFVL